MQHRCTVGSCACCHVGGFTNSPSFSFLVPSQGSRDKQPAASSFDEFDYGSPVDCTLSLGTPSTRSSSGLDAERRSSAASGSFQGGKTGCGYGNDGLLARRCVNCDTTSTPLWRNGPRGPKSLCNACGIRFKKEKRRAAAAMTLPPSASPHTYNSHNAWIHTQSHNKLPPSCFITTAIGNEFLFANDDGVTGTGTGVGAGQDSEMSFLSWRLNVSDRRGLVHDFTR